MSITEDRQALKLLKSYQIDVNILLKKYFIKEIARGQKIDPLAVSAVKSIRKFVLAGGKRLRPAIMYYGYLAAGGKDIKAIKKASMSIELIHSFLLIHDDIMDQDNTRHGIDTIHQKYTKLAKKYFKNKDNKHFGSSMAIIVGDLCYTMANKVLFKADFDAIVILKALNKLQNIVYEVIPGQMMDLKLGFKGSATEREILRVQEAKTAYYTFEGPMHLGCVLAENNNAVMLKSFTKYALAMGKAFQIRDDILGIFGDEEVLGKPVGSDIIEGKRTLLTNYVSRKGSAQDKKVIKSMLGNSNLTKRSLQQFRKVIKESGSLEYSKKKGNEMVMEAIKALDKVVFKNKEAEVFFRGIAKYIVNRDV